MTAAARWAAGALVLLATVGALAGCSSSTGKPMRSPSTKTVIHTYTLAGPNLTPAPATSVPALGDRTTAPKGERFGRCPYIGNGAGASGGDVAGKNIANLEGDRVGRSTILTTYRPVGCRFYFAYSNGDTRHEAVADILPTTFATPTQAHNAMVRTAQAGRSLQSEPGFVPGVDGIRYRTRFFGPDGARDWAFVFAKGRIMVVVHTQQNDSSTNAVLIAKAIVGKF